MSTRNGIGIMYYYSSIWNSGSYVLQVNKKIGLFIKMFVCTELHKNANVLKKEEKDKLMELILKIKEIKKTLILSDMEEPSFEEYKSYLSSVYKTFDEEEKNGIINLSTPNKLRLIADLCEPLSKFNALNGSFIKLQQYERYKAKKIEEGLKNRTPPIIQPLTKFQYTPLDDIKYFAVFKPELMEIGNLPQNQMMNNMNMNDNMNNNMNYNMNNNMNNNMNYSVNNNMNYNINNNMNMNYNQQYNMNNQHQNDYPDIESIGNYPNLNDLKTEIDSNPLFNNPFPQSSRVYVNTETPNDLKDELIEMSDSLIEEKKNVLLSKNKEVISELKKNNISMALQLISNSIGILKSFPKDSKSDFL